MCISFSLFPLVVSLIALKSHVKPGRWQLKFDDNSTKSAVVLRVDMPYPTLPTQNY